MEEDRIVEHTRVEEVKVGALQLKYLACKTNPDVQAGIYEGGYQLWECTLDLLEYLSGYDFNGKVVMDVGCGQGLLGILALLRGAQCVLFQDFNLDVIKQLTIPNIRLNVQHDPNLFSRCRFEYEDWSALQPYELACQYRQFDVVLGSELIYNSSSYSKLADLFNCKLKDPSGEAILANKVVYFGCGGNLNEFKEHLQQRGLDWQQLQRIVPKYGGNKKEITAVRIRH